MSVYRFTKTFVKLCMKGMPLEAVLKLRFSISSRKCYQLLQSKEANHYVFCCVSILSNYIEHYVSIV
jgi:hypothetical protein